MKSEINCFDCDGIATLIATETIVLVRGEPVPILAFAYKCFKCRSEFTTTESDTLSMSQVFKKQESWINKIAANVFDACIVLEHIRDYPKSPTDEEGWTELEKAIYEKLSPIWELCRKHPEYTEPTHESDPDLIDGDGEIIPNFERVEPLSEQERNEIRVIFDDSMRTAIRDFCKEKKITKQKFAAVYGCTPSYLSNVLAGHKNLDFSLLVGAIHRFGFTPSIDPLSKRWSFEVTTRFL